MEETISDRCCTSVVTLINSYLIMIYDEISTCKVLSVFIKIYKKNIILYKPNRRI